MIRISGVRALAMSLTAIGLGSAVALDNATTSASTMAHYRSLSQDALLQELASQNNSSVIENIGGALFAVAAIVVTVDVLTYILTAVWNRIGPAQPPAVGGPPPDVSGAA